MRQLNDLVRDEPCSFENGSHLVRDRVFGLRPDHSFSQPCQFRDRFLICELGLSQELDISLNQLNAGLGIPPVRPILDVMQQQVDRIINRTLGGFFAKLVTLTVGCKTPIDFADERLELDKSASLGPFGALPGLSRFCDLALSQQTLRMQAVERGQIRAGLQE